MSKHFGSSPEIHQSTFRTVFLIQKKETSVFCGLCKIFDQQSTAISKKQIKTTNKSGLKYFQKRDINLVKLSKKSLKGNKKFKDSLLKMESIRRIQQNLQSQKIQKSTNMNSEIILHSNTFKKTQSSQKGNYFCSTPVHFSQQQKRPRQMSYSSSCINLKNNFHKSTKVLDQKNTFQRFSNVPLTKSVSSQFISTNKSLKLSTNEINRNIIQENTKVQHLRFKSSVSQNFSSLQISPVRHLPIPEESERQGLISSNRNDRDETTINKLLDIQSRQNLSKSNEQNLSNRTFKINHKSNNLEQNMIEPFSQIRMLPVIPQIQKDLSLKSGSNKDYLEISFDKTQQLEQKKSQNENLFSDKKILKNQKIQENLLNSIEFEIKIVPEKVLSSDIGSDLNEPQHTQIAQRHDIRIQKPIKAPSTNIFGRYSVQIPKSKNFNNLKVRRTISMKDQQDSSQEETSQVIYGFRNINNLVVMEDIAQDMQESYMTRRETNFDSLEKLSMRQI